MYECRAENEVGGKGVLINLSGVPKQSIFKSSPIPSIGKTFNLLWQTESYTPISEYRLKFRLFRGRRNNDDWREITIPAEYSDAPIHTAAYRLPGLDIGVVYEVAVVSRNRYGWGEQSKIYRFATGGEGEWGDHCLGLECVVFLCHNSFPVDSPSFISEETVDDGLTLDGSDLDDNSIDELPGVFDYYGSASACFVSKVLLISLLVVSRVLVKRIA